MVCAAVAVMKSPAVPVSALKAAVATVCVGAVVSSVKLRALLAVPGLPATSVICAVSVLLPSKPKSALSTVKLAKPLLMSALLRVTVLGVPKALPPSSSCTVSPATAVEPVVGKVARKVVVAASALFIRLSARSVLPFSANVGAAGAVVSSV